MRGIETYQREGFSIEAEAESRMARLLAQCRDPQAHPLTTEEALFVAVNILEKHVYMPSTMRGLRNVLYSLDMIEEDN